MLIFAYLQFVVYLHFVYLCIVKLINKQIKCKKNEKKKQSFVATHTEIGSW